MRSYGIRRRFTAALAFAAIAYGGGQAFAHATLIESTPAKNAILAKPPHEIRLRFNARIEERMTRMTLKRNDGTDIPVKVSQSAKGNVLTVAVPELGPGIYTLGYKVMATDSHITEESISFTVLKH